MDMIVRAKYALPNVNWRYLVAPTTKLETGVIPFNFDHDEIEHNIAAGKRDAKNVVGMGEGTSFDALESYYTAKVKRETSLEYGEWLKQPIA